MKDSDKGLLALAVIIGYFYMSKSRPLTAAQRRYTDPVYARKGNFKWPTFSTTMVDTGDVGHEGRRDEER